MTRYTCGFFPRILAIIPATRYTCVFLSRILAFFPALWGFYSQVFDHFLTSAHIYAHQKAHIYALQTSMCIWVTESRRITGTELYRQQKTPSCTMKLKSMAAMAALISRRVRFLFIAPNSSSGCWLPDNGFVGIRGLSLERLCTLSHEC